MTTTVTSTQRSAQSQGAFLPTAARLLTNFTTSSTTYVDSGLSIASVPNGAKILYNLWVAANNGTTTWQILAGATQVATNSTTQSSAFKFQNYSATISNTSGSTATVDVQIHTDNGVNTASLFAAGTTNSSIICYSGTTAIIFTPATLLTTLVPLLGKCQISNLAWCITSSTLAMPVISLGPTSVNGANTNASLNVSRTFAVEMQFPVLNILASSALTDADICIVVDITGDMITVS